MKTQLDKWDNLIVFYAKGWFDKISPETEILHNLRCIMAERCCIDIQFVKAENIVSVILRNIIYPFLLHHNSDIILCKIIEDSSPEHCWRTGYTKGIKFIGGDTKIPETYNYFEAMIYNLMSIIRCSEVKYFPGLTGKADEELFKKCIKRINKD